MEPLPLFQFWHIPSDTNITDRGDSDTDNTFTSCEITNTNDGDRQGIEMDDEDSFFDLEFTVPLQMEQKDLGEKDDGLVRKLLPLERSNCSKPQSPTPFLKSPPKLRILTLLKNSSSKKTEVSIFSLINRGNSPRSKLQKQKSENAALRFPKDVVQKYLKLIKPLYSRASKRFTTQTAKFADEISKSSPFTSPSKQVQNKPGSIRAGCKHLGKSRSASSVIRSAPFPARRDDSLLLHDEGIQSAILHCKRSYNSSIEFDVLSRSACRSFTEEVKTRTSI